MKISKNIPALRFPGFEGEWEMSQIKEHTIESAFGPRFSSNFYNENGNVATLRTTDLNDNGDIDFKMVPIASLDIDQYREHLLQQDDLVISRSGTIGVTGIFKGYHLPVLPGAFLIRFRLKPLSLSPEFIKQYFNSKNGRNKLLTLSAGGVQKNLTGTSILELYQKIPSLPEQTRIASFLTAVDQRINLLTQQKEALELYKKGVMQQLFPSTGSGGKPQLRFKDENGNDFPDWEEKRLGEVATFRRGSFPQPYGLPKWYDDKNGTPFVQVFDVDDNFKLKPSTKQKISELAKPMSVFVQEGSIVLTIQGSIGRIAITQYDSYVDRTLLIFQSFKCDIDKLFFTYIIFLLFEIEKEKAVGGTIKTITKEKLSDFKINLPSLAEQQKIASFLSSIDAKIEQVSQQIEQCKTWKKGLLQKMFV